MWSHIKDIRNANDVYPSPNEENNNIPNRTSRRDMGNQFSDLYSTHTQVIGATVALVFLSAKWMGEKKNLPPGPHGLPIVGNWFDMPKEKPWEVYREWSKLYASDIIHMNVFGTNMIIVNSQKAAKEMFDKKSALYGDRPRMTMVNEVMGLDWHFGFMHQGPTWTTHRKIFSKDFNSAVVSKFNAIEVTWRNIFAKNLLNRPEDFLTHIQHLASGLALESTHGLQVQESGKPDPFIQAATKALEGLAASGLYGSYLVDFFPSLKYVPSWVPFSPFRQAKEWRAAVDIAGTVPFSMATTAKTGPSVLSGLLDGGAFKRDDVRMVTAAMYANGSAATVTALSSFFLAMVLYPEVQIRARKELDNLLHGRLPEFSDERSLPYISAIVKEVLRWHPAVPMAFPHRLTSDDSYNGFELPAGSVIIPNSWALLHDPDVYGSDVDAFNPERFLTKDGKLNPELADQIAFGYGRRALQTLYINIATILTVFEISNSGAAPSGEYTTGLLR
uniref:Putative cytochrome P450 n=1 Tax=Moniliophthora roreri TaxID=221103 RepID=A0A0W0FRE5_MONRR